jgi:pimeloyl-ACP methyl ester carboxylesterase
MIDWLTSKNGGIQCPVALIYGDPQYDWMQMSHGKQLMEKLHEEGVHCECTFVPGTGHILFIDDPDGFNAAIIDACSRARLKENTKI